jgi:hypothetical protein
MPIYRLEPIEHFFGEESWRHSLLKAICRVKAADEDSARNAVAQARAKTVDNPNDLMESPWLSPLLAMCIEERAQVSRWNPRLPSELMG